MNELIEKILKAKRFDQLMESDIPRDQADEVKAILKQIHPDVCDDPRAKEATQRFNQLREEYTGGKTYQDESGEFTLKGNVAIYSGDGKYIKGEDGNHKYEEGSRLRDKSYDNYKTLMAFAGKKAEHFKKYLPKTMDWEPNGHQNDLDVTFHERAVPLRELLDEGNLDQVHVNWIFSRLLEICSWFQEIGFSHCGLNPESVFVMPENHGIQIGSFYMMTPIGKKPTISGKYQDWYPADLFKHKKAIPAIDVELSKRIACMLLGDRSGTGIILKRDPKVNKEVLDFLIKYEEEAGPAWHKYREILKKNFKEEFHELEI